MATIAELLIKVDTSQVSKATESLKKFEDASSRVGKSTTAISKDMEDVSKSTDTFASAKERLIERAKEMAATVGQGRTGVLDYRAALAGVSSEVKEYTDRTRQLAEIQKNQASIDKEVLRSKEKYSEEQYRFSQSLQEEIALYGKSKEEIKGLTAARLGLSEQYSLYLDFMSRHKELADMIKNTEGTSLEGSSKSIAESIKTNEQEIYQKEELIRIEQERMAVAQEGADAVRSHLAAHKERVKELNAENSVLRTSIRNNSNLATSEKEVAKTSSQVKEEARKTAEEFKKLKYAVDPASKSLDTLKERAKQAEIALNKARDGVGGLSVEETTKVFNRANSDLKHFQGMSDTTGKTVKELNFAMRGLPAQFTDIAVSLQGGQRPLTVFLQQGGQLKDMFGGIGPAAKAMTGYIINLITPLNLAIASLGFIGVAAYSGSRDLDNLNKALILTGLSSTANSGKMLDYARSVSSIGGSVGSAVGAISLLVDELSYSDETLINAAAAAIAYSDATGSSVEEVVEDFKKLGKDPVKAVVELNSKYKFLTVSVYEQVRALQENGEAQKAAETAMNAMAESSIDKALIIKSSAGVISRAWWQIKSAGVSVYDTFADLGRIGEGDVLRILTRRLEQATVARDNLLSTDSFGSPVNVAAMNAANKAVDEAREALLAYNREIDRTNNQPRVDFIVKLDAQIDKNKSKVRQAEEALKDFADGANLDSLADDGRLEDFNTQLAILTRNLKDAKDEASGLNLLRDQKMVTDELRYQVEHGKSMGTQQKAYNSLVKELEVISERVRDGSASEAERAKFNMRERLLAGAKENVQLEKQIELNKENEALLKKSSRIKVSEAERMKQSLASTEESLREQLLSNTKLGKEESKLHSMRRRFEEIELQSATRKLTLNETSLLNNKEELLTEQLKNVQLEKSIRLKRQSEKIDEMQSRFGLSLADNRGRASDKSSTRKLSDSDVSRQSEYNSLLREQSKALLDAHNNSKGDEGYYLKQAEAINSYYEVRIEQLQDYYALEDELRSDWESGFTAGFENFLDSQRDLYSSMKTLTDGTLRDLTKGLSRGIVDAIAYGEDLNDVMKNLALTISDKVLEGLVEIGVQYAINAAKEMALDKAVGASKQAIIHSTSAASSAATAQSTAEQATAAATTASSWTPAALAASVGSFGSAAAVGLAALVASIALFKGFRKGGYTGNGGVDDVAGVVHGKEFVFDAESTARIGVDNLEKIRRGESLSEAGGSRVSSTSSSTSNRGIGGGGGSIITPVEISVHLGVVESGGGSGDNSDEGATGDNAEQGRRIQEAVKVECDKAIHEGLRTGGSIWRAINNR